MMFYFYFLVLFLFTCYSIMIFKETNNEIQIHSPTVFYISQISDILLAIWDPEINE